MNRQPDDPGFDGEVSVGWLAKSLARGIVDGLRRNKLATILAALTLLVLIGFAIDNRFDGLAHYQESILPRLLRLEIGFYNSLRVAENTSGEWRAYYFKNAHTQVRDILRAARLDRPEAYVARRKHRQFIRYYELLDEQFNTIAMQLVANPNLDYVHQMTEKMKELRPIRDGWAEWAGQTRKNVSPSPSGRGWRAAPGEGSVADANLDLPTYRLTATY